MWLVIWNDFSSLTSTLREIQTKPFFESEGNSLQDEHRFEKRQLTSAAQTWGRFTRKSLATTEAKEGNTTVGEATVEARNAAALNETEGTGKTGGRRIGKLAAIANGDETCIAQARTASKGMIRVGTLTN